ncbi:MAG: PspC domain-containing protein [Chitinophagales bacterium]
MKKTINVNLGGMAFIMDENAFEALHTYLETLKRKFSNQAERDEIISDIESRIGEMLNQRLNGRKEVISAEDVEAVIAIMGKPEDIAGDDEPATQAAKEEAQTTTTGSTSYAYATDGTVKKRLFRDPDDKRVAGVIAGLCHYFGIDDPTWLRLAVILLCFVSFGTILLIYFLLMIVIPTAETPSEKLQMRGEPVNIKTIEKEVKEAANRAADSMRGIVKDKTFFERLGEVAVAIIKVFGKIILAFFIVIGLIILFALLAGLFGVSIAGNMFLTEAPELIVANPGTVTLLKIGLMLFVTAPIIGLLYTALRLIFGKRTHVRWLSGTLSLVWLVGTIMLLVAGVRIFREYKVGTTTTERVALTTPANNNLLVVLTDSSGLKAPAEDDGFNYDVSWDGIMFNDEDISNMNSIPVDEPNLELGVSPDSSFYLQTSISARGRNKRDALQNTALTPYHGVQKDSVLNLPAYLEMAKTGKLRFQRAKLLLLIPEGKKISFADNIDRWYAVVRGNSAYNDTRFANTTWTVENGAVKCIKGENHFRTDDESKLEDKQDKLERKMEEQQEKLERKMERMQDKIDAAQDKLDN